MKNITVSVSDEVYRQARIRAAQEGRSVSALVSDFLARLGGAEAEFSRLEALQDRVFNELTHFDGSNRLSRDEVHERAVR